MSSSNQQPSGMQNRPVRLQPPGQPLYSQQVNVGLSPQSQQHFVHPTMYQPGHCPQLSQAVEMPFMHNWPSTSELPQPCVGGSGMPLLSYSPHWPAQNCIPPMLIQGHHYILRPTGHEIPVGPSPQIQQLAFMQNDQQWGYHPNPQMHAVVAPLEIQQLAFMQNNQHYQPNPQMHEVVAPGGPQQGSSYIPSRSQQFRPTGHEIPVGQSRQIQQPAFMQNHQPNPQMHMGVTPAVVPLGHTTVAPVVRQPRVPSEMRGQQSSVSAAAVPPIESSHKPISQRAFASAGARPSVPKAASSNMPSSSYISSTQARPDTIPGIASGSSGSSRNTSNNQSTQARPGTIPGLASSAGSPWNTSNNKFTQARPGTIPGLASASSGSPWNTSNNKSKVTHSTSAPNLVERGGSSDSPLSDYPPVLATRKNNAVSISKHVLKLEDDFPPVSATVRSKVTVSKEPLEKEEDLQMANKTLVERIRSALDNDEERYSAFKEISGEFRQGVIGIREYLSYVQQFGLTHLVLELARLCPDTQKQRELIENYNAIVLQSRASSNNSSNKGKGKKKLAEEPDNSLANNVISSVRKLHANYKPSEEDVKVLSKDGYRASKGKSVAEEILGSSSANPKPLDYSVGSVSENSAAGKGGSSKDKKKKMPKFQRMRLGEAASLDLEDTSDSLDGVAVRGAWRNGGGQAVQRQQSSSGAGSSRAGAVPEISTEPNRNDPRSWNEVFNGFDKRMRPLKEVERLVGLPPFRDDIPGHFIHRRILETTLCLLKSGKCPKGVKIVLHLRPPLHHRNHKEVSCDGAYTKGFRASFAAVARNEDCWCDGLAMGRTEELTPDCLVHELIGVKFGLRLAEILKYEYLYLKMDSEAAARAVRKVIHSLLRGNKVTCESVPLSIGSMGQSSQESKSAYVKRVKSKVLGEIAKLIRENWLKNGEIRVRVKVVYREGNVMADNLTHLVSNYHTYEPIIRLYGEPGFYIRSNVLFEYRDWFSCYLRFSNEYEFIRKRDAAMKLNNTD